MCRKAILKELAQNLEEHDPTKNIKENVEQMIKPRTIANQSIFYIEHYHRQRTVSATGDQFFLLSVKTYELIITQLIPNTGKSFFGELIVLDHYGIIQSKIMSYGIPIKQEARDNEYPNALLKFDVFERKAHENKINQFILKNDDERNIGKNAGRIC